MPFSVLILTLNEEENISECLDSVHWCNDIVVLDSFSSDRTCDLARARGARVYQRSFDSFAGQRNYALEEIEYRHNWIFHLDADERFNEDLRLECERVIALDSQSAWCVPNRIIFMGKWIKRCTQYPYPQVRLVKKGEVRFQEAGHGQREYGARRGVGYISVPYDHFNFSKGVEDWIGRHNRYSSDEAVSESGAVKIAEFVSSDALTRKRAAKALLARLPFRSMLKFLYLYFLRLGFLDGRPGYYYCRMQAMYEFMITLKMFERRSNDDEA